MSHISAASLERRAREIVARNKAWRVARTPDPEPITAADIPWRAGDEGCGYLTAEEYSSVFELPENWATIYFT